MSRPARGGIVSGSAWNFVGQALPLLVAVAAIPWLIRLIGLERFGFLALAWVLVGYAGLFDLGIGRALIRTVAARLGAGDEAGALRQAQAGLSLLAALGLLIGALGLAAAAPLAQRVLVVPPALQTEATQALVLLALSMPFVMLSNGYVAVLNAHESFKRLNLVRAALSLASYGLPLAVALAGWVALPAVVGAIVLVRALGTLVFAHACRQSCALAWRPAWPPAAETRPLLAVGGWMSVSNLVSPLLSQLDRLILGALVPLRAVGIYAAPADLTSRLMAVPYAIVGAFFPRASHLVPGSAAAAQAQADLTRWLYWVMLPPLVVLMALAWPALTLWLGEGIGGEAALVLQLLLPGVLANTLAQGPATLIQAAGRPRDMALLHLAELPLFLLLLWALTARLGIVGTALAASLRLLLDTGAVFWLARRGGLGAAVRWRTALPALGGAALVLAAVSPCRSWALALPVALGAGAAVAAVGWRIGLLPHERERLRAVILRR
jgi:O-antigen/teichoic acid export membrane protein